MAWNVWVDTGNTYPDGVPQYALLSVNGRTEWKTKRIAQKHAAEYKAHNLRDSWIEES